MQVQSTTSATQTTDPTSASSSTSAPLTDSVDYNMFLNLLMAEMKNQDPTNPTDTSEYMSQFAQFSTVEQAIQTNSKLDSLLTSNALAQADSLIGRTATYTTAQGAQATGTIVAISIVSGGAVATLSDGSTTRLDAGVTIS